MCVVTGEAGTKNTVINLLGDTDRFSTEYDGDGNAWLVGLLQPGERMIDASGGELKVLKEGGAALGAPRMDHATWLVSGSGQALDSQARSQNEIPDDYGVLVKQVVDGLATVIPYQGWITEGIRMIENVSTEIIQLRERLTRMNTSSVELFMPNSYSSSTTLSTVLQPSASFFMSILSD